MTDPGQTSQVTNLGFDEKLAGSDALRLTEIHKRFPGVHAIKGVSLTIRRGEVHALVGENGAGKSTLMAIASGEQSVDSGSIEICGTSMFSPSPGTARSLGLAIVHQEPALLPDLTVSENLEQGQSHETRPRRADLHSWAQRALSIWQRESPIDVRQHVRELGPGSRFIVEITKALIHEPQLLILDEPTEHLSLDDTEQLFAKIRELSSRGCAVLYISHRLNEVKRIAERITVLRDGAARGTFDASDVSEAQIVNLIVGRSLDAVFPPKPAVLPSTGAALLSVDALSGPGFSDLHLSLEPGEIVGMTGIEGAGQRSALRTLAGLSRSRGTVQVAGKAVTRGRNHRAASAGIAYLTSDRAGEGVLTNLTVRENASLTTLANYSRAGLMSRRAERSGVGSQTRALAVKTPSIESDISSLSGGNQQKVILSRVLESLPRVLLADEPTQGVDVGSRAEIYSILRSTASKGTAVLVVSSDFVELAGLCDRVIVFSRGYVVKELVGDEVAERGITEAVLTATTLRESVQEKPRTGWTRFLRSDLSPAMFLAVAILGLGLYTSTVSPFFLTGQNWFGILTLFATLAFVALGQQVTMLIGGIDLSVGPLMGLIVVVASYVLTPDNAMQGWGWILLIAVAVATGVINWSLTTMLRMPPLLATLVVYIALQGISLALRPVPAGEIDTVTTDAIATKIGFVPVAALVAVVVGVFLEVLLLRSRIGSLLRSIGTRPDVATRVGINTKAVTLVAYVVCSLLALLAAITLLGQVGTGDPTSGINYTLSSITAVVLGGASVFGGRGSFVGVLLGALLIQVLYSMTVFLDLSNAWQLYLLGLLTLVAVGVYSRTRAAGHAR